MEPRPACLRCRRPQQVCVCSELHRVESRTRVVFVQHPREARMPVSTCRLAHLSLPNSEMYVAGRAEGVPSLLSVAQQPGTMVLFPGPGSVDVTELEAPPRALIVVDGTWIDARKLVQRSPALAALPRLGFRPATPSNYRIRREPAPHCLSTIEAVVHILEELEDAPGRYTPILAAFTRMVDLQLGYVAARSGSAPRHAARPSLVDGLRARADKLVLAFAEGWDKGGPHIHWVGVRPSTGERFESVFRPEHALSNPIPRDLGVPDTVQTEPLAAALERWRAFIQPGDVVGTWGNHTVEVLAGQQVALDDVLDLKHLISNVTRTSLGGVEVLAARLGGELPEGQGRPMRKLVALDIVMRGLYAGRLRVGGVVPADRTFTLPGASP